MKTLKIRIETMEPMLGTASNNKELHETYIASKAPDAKKIEEEVAAIGVDGKVEMARTVFPRNEEGEPIIWDYQIKGFFKDSCGALRKVKGTESSKIKAYKKEIDGLIFPQPRQIKIEFDGEIGSCQRPLRASTPQGERTAIADSEEIPAGATIEFEVVLLSDSHEKAVLEWLEYGKLRGLGQWRNSGKGRFNFTVL